MGKKAIEIAIRNINAKEKQAPQQEVIETELVIRNSTRKL